MVAMPANTPVTTLLVIPTVAVEVLLLVHRPVPASLKVMLAASHTVPAPVIADGFALITTPLTAIPQPLLSVYVILADPTPTPVTRPLASTVAIAVPPLLQTPPAVALLNAEVSPWQMLDVPDIDEGK